MVRLELIDEVEATLTRVTLNAECVRRYAEKLVEASDLEFPPIDLFQETGKELYHLGDGRHRLAAYRLAERKLVPACLHPGGQRDAILFGISSNDAHGLPMTPEDKRKNIEWLLNDPEWGRKSTNTLAAKAHCSTWLVSQVRSRYDAEQAALTPKDKEAKNKETSPPSPGGASAPETRTGLDGKEYRVKERRAPGTGSPEAQAQLVDAHGALIPEKALAAFSMLATFTMARATLDELLALVDTLEKSTASAWMPTQAIKGSLKQLAHDLETYKPAAVCPHCQGNNLDCGVCKGVGWVDKQRYDRYDEASKKKVVAPSQKKKDTGVPF